MLVDKTKAETFDYSYAFIQYKNISTIEQYNFGIILKDGRGNTLTHLPTLSHTIDMCLELENKTAINYTLDKVKETIDNLGSIKEGQISDALTISMYRPFSTDLNPEEALDYLVNEYITLKKLRVLEKQISTSKYDKRSIIRLMTAYVEQKNITNFVHHRKFPITFKPIDMSLVDKDGKPYSIATITSPHVDNFQESFVTNIFTLQDAKRKGNIKNMFLHAPIYKDVKTKNIASHIGWAREQAQNYNLGILTDHREAAVMERLLN